MAIAQQPGYKYVPSTERKINKPNQRVLNPLATEICNNAIDDDGNGLADLKDFSCYFNANTENCEPTSIIWGCTSSEFYWADVATGTVQNVGPLADYIYDITWASDGKLYGMSGNGTTLYEINPNTAELTTVAEFTNYYGANGMTADANGNLYLAGMQDEQRRDWYVIKYNIATGIITKVANLSNEGLSSGGDLTFLDGKLYVSCWDNKFAVIDLNMRKMTVRYLANVGSIGTSMGMITLGDGFLYVCGGDKIFRIDPVTMNLDFTPFFDFNVSGMQLFGLSSYAEICNAPACRPKLKIDTTSSPPFCSATGVQLKADGKGILTESVYEWILPDKTTKRGADLQVTTPGKYYLHYYAIYEACERWDSINVQIIPTPWIDLGTDKLVCKNTPVELMTQSSGGIDNYVWSDEHVSATNTVQGAGMYWVQATNSCGTVRDTIIITETTYPEVAMGPDLLVCPGTTVNLLNTKPRQNEDVYLWQDGSANETFNSVKDGWYWLQSQNVCGTVRDSIFISYKDSCTCFPLYPQIALGNDLSICDYETVTLKNRLDQTGFRYNWQNGSTDKAITTKTPGTYWVDVTTYCGILRDSIVIIEKTEGCERKVMVPSAFTPNSDGRNDVFRPTVYGVPDEYDFIIYNRWGQIVFRSKKPGEGWNGTVNGKKQDVNLYAWTCSYRFSGEGQQSAKGTVALLK